MHLAHVDVQAVGAAEWLVAQEAAQVHLAVVVVVVESTTTEDGLAGPSDKKSLTNGPKARLVQVTTRVLGCLSGPLKGGGHQEAAKALSRLC